MKVTVVGGGPGGLYAALLCKKTNPDWEISLFERNSADDTFGFGVVFSDATLGLLKQADEQTFSEIQRHFAYWDEIDIHYLGEVLTSTGHGFCGLGRMQLLKLLQTRCQELGVVLHFDTEVADLSVFADSDLIVAADGVNSGIREAHSDAFQPTVVSRPNYFVWLGSSRKFDAFTFYFKENEHGLWRVHAYQYAADSSTFIVEATEATVRAAGLENASEDEICSYCETLFAEELNGAELRKNRSVWRRFPTIRNEHWYHENIVLLGDSVHTAHFSIGSGTKLAMEGAIALVDALNGAEDIPTGLADYEANHRPPVDSLQRAAQVSLEWFEETERYFNTLEPPQFGMSLLTRSLRITHENLKLRDPAYVAGVDRWFAEKVRDELGLEISTDPPPPPMFAPYKIRDMVLQNRVVVSPMCQYSSEDGMPNEWHLVHLGSRAIGGAGLIITEMTNVSEEGRITPGCTGLYRPEHVEGWRRITDFVHDHSYAKMAIQLSHAGRKGSTRLLWEGMDQPLASGNWPIVAASAIPYLEESQVPREMTREDMDEVCEDFKRAASMAYDAGFDMLELHFAHGYLLASFLSPLTNHRTDEYGGSLENRLRYPLEVFDAVREVWPEARPISVRISATDWADGGSTPADAVEIAKALKAHGCDIIDVSSGQTVAHEKPVYGRLFQTPFSDRIRHEADIPTMTVGNISSYGDVNSILSAGRADLCVLARAHLFDPYWTRHAAAEQGFPLPWPEQYNSLSKYNFRFM